jgi:predicted amidohydrolase
MAPVRIAALQFDVRRGDVAANLERVEAGLREAAGRGVALVALPEMWPTSFVELEHGTDWLAPTERALERVRELSRELDLAVCGSAFARPDGAAPGALPRNRLTVHDQGRVALEYDKVHLFTPTGEKESFSAGGAPPGTVSVRGVRLSGLVCYDLRFAPLLRAPWLDAAELLVAPAQWPAARSSHWRALLLGRAVEHQAVVLGANRTGRDVAGRRGLELHFPGDSLIAGPDGKALAEGDGRDGLVVAELDLDAVRRLRREVPVRRDERPAAYRPR